MLRSLLAVVIGAIALSFPQGVAAEAAQSPAVTIRAALSASDGELNYEQAKLAFDRIVAPELDAAAWSAEIDQLANAAKAIAANGSDIDKLKAVRQVIYNPGPWNGGRAFAYDHADPYGRDLRNKLLSTYLDTRLGNCVSMPILQLIVAERLGLNVSLSTAPNHVFMRYTNRANGRSIAIESTSGGHPARETEYHEKMGVTDAQVKSGIYLGVITKRESIAVMAGTVTEWLMSKGRYADAIAVTDVILEFYPKDIHALLWRGSAYGQLMRREFQEDYPTPASIPISLRARYLAYASRADADFKRAEELGWKPEMQTN